MAFLIPYLGKIIIIDCIIELYDYATHRKAYLRRKRAKKCALVSLLLPIAIISGGQINAFSYKVVFWFLLESGLVKKKMNVVHCGRPPQMAVSMIYQR